MIAEAIAYLKDKGLTPELEDDKLLIPSIASSCVDSDCEEASLNDAAAQGDDGDGEPLGLGDSEESRPPSPDSVPTPVQSVAMDADDFADPLHNWYLDSSNEVVLDSSDAGKESRSPQAAAMRLPVGAPQSYGEHTRRTPGTPSTYDFAGPVEEIEPDHGSTPHWNKDPTWTPALDKEVRWYWSKGGRLPVEEQKVDSTKFCWRNVLDEDLHAIDPAIRFIFKRHRQSPTPKDAEQRIDSEDGMFSAWQKSRSFIATASACQTLRPTGTR